jgi:hypothetical protein
MSAGEMLTRATRRMDKRPRDRITAATFSFYWTWEDFLGPLLYLQDPPTSTRFRWR